MAAPAASTVALADQLSYAMGQLQASSESHAQEIARLRDAQETLPDRLANALGPRFLALETRVGGIDTRVAVLEQLRWKVTGGVIVVAGVVGYGVKFLPALKLG